jgi:mRNA-degrading endonuclease RelE of RelBE toxin-antitoxin system
MNDLIATSMFSKLLRKKKNEGSQRPMLEKIETAIELLRNSKNPESLGKKKKGKLRECYAYELTKSSRVLYQVERREGKIYIVLLRVCNHKETYDTD